MELILTKDRETKRMVRYKEDDSTTESLPHVGTIYVRKDMFSPMPEKIKLVITPA